MRFSNSNFFILCLITAGTILSGCQSQRPVLVDTGDIERLRYEYRQLMDEYNKLQQDYQRLAERSQFYADYYQYATERIAAGTDELAKIGASSADEITKIRNNIAILRKIINGIIEGQQNEGRQNPQTDRNEQ